jgi:hypothetical protein
MGKSASAPDPAATAYYQGQSNLEAARASAKLGNPDTVGPTGTVTHDFRPDDTVSTTTTLSPGQQQIFNAVQGGETIAANRMQGVLGTGVDTSGLSQYRGVDPSAYQGITSTLPQSGPIATGFDSGGQARTDFSTGQPLAMQGTQDYGAQRKEVEDAIMSRVQPQYDKQRDTLNANLAAQGFNVNTAGYRNAADESNRNLTDARMQAVLAGGQEQSRLFGLDQSRLGFNNAASQAQTKQYNDALAAMNAGQQQQYNQNQGAAAFGNQAQAQQFGQGQAAAAFGNQAQQQFYNQQAQGADPTNAMRQQQLNEALQLRSQPINEVSSLFGLGNQIAAPQAAPFQGSAIAAPNYAQLAQNKYAADSANATSTNNAEAQAASTAAMMAMMLL